MYTHLHPCNAVASLDNDTISVNTVQSVTPKRKIHNVVTCSPETSYATEHNVEKVMNTDMISEYNLVVNLPPLTESHKKVVSFHTDTDKKDTHKSKGESVNTTHVRPSGSTYTREESTKFPARVFTSRTLDIPNQPSHNLNNTKKHRRQQKPLLR